MKKLFTLIAAVFVSVSLSAQSRETLWEGEQTMDSSWPSVQISSANFATAKVGDKIVVTVSKADNSINTGWQWGPQVFINVDWAGLKDTSAQSLSESTEPAEVSFEISEDGLAQISAANEVEVQGMNLVVSKVELEVSLTYSEEGKAIHFDEYGIIRAYQFQNFSDDAKVVFTAEVTGSDGYVGWGYGKITSTDENQSVVAYDYDKFPVTGEGANKFSCTVGDLAEVLSTGSLAWSVWGFGDGACTITRTSVVVYEVEGVTVDTWVIGSEDNVTPWWTAFSDVYTIPANYTFHTEFVNYTDGATNWNNFLVALANTPLGSPDYSAASEYFVVRADNYGWGAYYDEETRESNWDWDNYATIMNGANVSLDVIRWGMNVVVDAAIDGADGNSYYQRYSMNIGEDKEDTYAFLTVENGHLLLDTSKTYVSPTLEDPTGIDAVKTMKTQSALRYNLAGQQVDAAYKGIVIENGKKIVVK